MKLLLSCTPLSELPPEIEIEDKLDPSGRATLTVDDWPESNAGGGTVSITVQEAVHVIQHLARLFNLNLSKLPE